MIVLTFLLALPVAVSTLGAALRFRDDAEPATVVSALAIRLFLLAVLVWLGGPLPVAAALVTAVVAQFASFYGIRLYAGAGREPPDER
jgi:O-antigen/teichoic acid export membrane protein